MSRPPTSLWRCVVCNSITQTRCTNRCCLDCHHVCCTAGGVTCDGHNLSRVAVESRRAALATAKAEAKT
jgi:hypothetical protein